MLHWSGGLVQGGDQSYGVQFAPSAAGVITAVTLNGLYQEGRFPFVQSLMPADGSRSGGITNLTIQNNRISRWDPPGTMDPPPMTFIDLVGVTGLVILNNRFFFAVSDTLLKLDACAGVVVGLNDINFSGPSNPQLINVQGTEVTGLNGSQISIGSSVPRTDEKLVVDGQSHFSTLVVDGQSHFGTVGVGTIPAGLSSITVTNPNVRLESHVMVTLKGNPGASCSMMWVTNVNGAFTIFLNNVAEQDTSFSYFIVDPIQQ